MAYFSSESVKIFPCASRGDQDLNAVVASEYNYTHLFGLSNGASSYIYSVVTEETEEGATYTYAKEVVINGYYFKFFPTDAEKALLTLDEGHALFIALTSKEEKSLLCSCAVEDVSKWDGQLDNNGACHAVCSGTASDNEPSINGAVVINLPLKSEYMATALTARVTNHLGNTSNPHRVTAAQLNVGAFEGKTIVEKVTSDEDNVVTGKAVYDAIDAAKNELKGSKAEGDTTAETIAGAKAYAKGLFDGITDNGSAPNINVLANRVTEIEKSLQADGATNKAIKAAQNEVDALEKIVYGTGGAQTPTTGSVMSDIDALQKLAAEGTGKVEEGVTTLVTGGTVHTAIDTSKTATINEITGVENDEWGDKYTIHSVKNYTDSLISALPYPEDYPDDRAKNLAGLFSYLIDRITALENPGTEESS